MSETSRDNYARSDSSAHPVVALCRALVASTKFEFAILGVIVVNAVVLGVETYYSPHSDAPEVLDLINDACLWIFVAELCVRLIACFPRPQHAFRDLRLSPDIAGNPIGLAAWPGHQPRQQVSHPRHRHAVIHVQPIERVLRHP